MQHNIVNPLKNHSSNSQQNITVFITVAPWNDTQQVEIQDLNLEIGDISVFFKEKGTMMKIRNLKNYNLFKLLDTNIFSNNTSNSSPFFSSSNGNSSSSALSFIDKSYQKKKKLLMSNDQSLLSYNIADQQRLELLQTFNKNQNESLPRWFYKVIVPSNQLEGILKDINIEESSNQHHNNNNNHHHHHHRHNHHIFERLNQSNSPPTQNNSYIGQNDSVSNINDIIENIKVNRLLTIDSPKRSTLSTSLSEQPLFLNHNNNKDINQQQQQQQQQQQSLNKSSGSLNNSGKWNKASPSVPIRKNSLLDHDYDSSLVQYSSSVSPNLEWLHARRVYDVVCKIESEFPNIMDSRQVENHIGMNEDKWESRISSSEDTFIKSLTMEDTLGSELIKQEYIEFSLRFENRTSILIGIEYSFVIWIDPIQTFFTVTCSANATVRDVYFLILQYLFPTDSNSNSSNINNNSNNNSSYESETFSLMSPYFGFYLQEENTSKLIPLQHKQLLINCNLNKSYETLFIFKRNNKKSVVPQVNNPYNNISSIPSLSLLPSSNNPTPPTSATATTTTTTPPIDEDEGYNLTVLFPTHQTYRQFHFIPTRTVNETIQTIISSTTNSMTFKNTVTPGGPTSPNSTTLIPTNNNGTSPPNSLVQPKGILSFSPSLISHHTHTNHNNNNNINNTNTLMSNSNTTNSPNTSNSNNQTTQLLQQKQNNIFETLDETMGFCLYFQKDGSGVWMEGNRRLISYNLPNETVVEFKPPPMVCKLALIEGINHTITLYCKSKVYTVLYGKYTTISQLEDLISKSLEPGNEKEFESYGLFLIRGDTEIFLSHHNRFQDIESELENQLLPNDYLEFKPSSSTTIDSVLKDAALAFGNTKEPTLIPGETQIFKRDGERFVADQPKKGCFIITNYRLIFMALNRSSYDDLTKDDIELPLTSIFKMKQTSNLLTEIHSKDFKFCIFHCQDSNLWHILKNMVEINAITRTFAFSNLETYDKFYDTIYNPFEEFQRLKFPLDKWRVTHCNSDYSLCPSYPSLFIVPIGVTDDDLKKIANFREKGRVPAICWIHRNHHSTITRCSQPRVGLARARCSEDEEYLKIITKSNTNSQKLYVMDSRPMANAKANTLLGKGHENTSLYQNVELQFLGIGNIHVMRDSFKKLYAILQNPETFNWLPMIDGTQWLEHIYQLINSANMVVELVDKKGSSVLTHCSDGWDRTSQLVALSQLLLDPYYRTIRGFQILIEKEWLSFGHLFTNRTAHIISPSSDDDFSPIFLLFMDAVWQLTCLLPTTFQFNEAFLIRILESVYNCRYKNFLFNNEKERLQYTKLLQGNGLPSLWPSINSNVEQYTNYFYIKNPKPIYENFFMCDIQFWSNFYLKWNERFKPKIQIDAQIIREIEELKIKKERKRQSKLNQQIQQQQQQQHLSNL
ncbi:Myotubularin-related protein 2 [Tieghemostelium lacteum]|uniref:Myotubularin-related protein 2 n=1 Tax=Tieghemostelium lacteum TaxID=361077 RepID=A0A151ZE44_TIELA|nr:Myotubularin-related protein 2 [Tieghemostelium lacteum]|eukprot:KYQ92228.1 Myotubularin-related protein 2 [Tieghemostelium lacteum]